MSRWSNRQQQPRIAIVGAGGQLGSELVQLLPPERAIPMTRATLDLTRADQVVEALTEVSPDLVINCAAYNLVDAAEVDPSEAFSVNAFGVRNLARVCKDESIGLVHVSTDYVFPGDQCEPYREADAPRPINAYGNSKLAGEFFVLTECPDALIVRTSGLYGAAGGKQKGGRGNFVDLCLRQGQAGGPLAVVIDQTTTPSHAGEVARRILELLQAGAGGIAHVTNSGECSWCEFARAVYQRARLPGAIEPVTSQEFALRRGPKPVARRPRYSVLANETAARLGLPPMRPWREALDDYLREIGAVHD